MAKNYITPQGLRRLQTEYDHLRKVERPEVTKLVAWAASLGDRSENADYQYGKKRLREIDRRLRFLAARIHEAVVVDPVGKESEKITFGATVRVCDEEGEEKVLSLVGVDESDTLKGRISWLSPLGKALMEKEVGDVGIVRAPNGERELEILEIDYNEIEVDDFVPTEAKELGRT